MQPAPNEGSVFVYGLRLRVPGSAESLPAPRLLVHVDDGMKAAPPPAQLSWTTQDGTQSAMGFSPDMASLYGHRRAPGGEVVEIRGELEERREYSLWGGGVRGYEFFTEVEDAGRWSSAGRLRVLIDDGSEGLLRWACWCDKSGNTWSIALHPVSPSGGEEVDGGGGFTGYRQRAGHALYPYRGTRVARPQVLLPQPLPERTAEWEGWQPGGSWLPLGGSLAMQSLTSPSGRFTALHAIYGPWFSVRDNATHEPVWVSDVPAASLLCLGPDGDLAAWNHRGERVWSADTGWRGAQRLEMRDTGELALTDADGAVVWSSGIPQLDAAAPAGLPAVARGSAMRRGESLHGQSLTSSDGSTVLYHDGRRLGVRVQDVSPGSPQWSRRDFQQQNALTLEDDGFLRVRAFDGTELEQIAGQGAELVVVRGTVVLRDDAGVIMWSSNGGSRPAPVREPALPQNADLAAWFAALVGPGRGYCIAVVKGATPHEVLKRADVAQESVVTATWQQLTQQRDTAHPHEGKVVAAIAVGPDVLVVSDDADLPVAQLAPGTSVAALHLPRGGDGYGTTFSFHRDGRLLSEISDEPRRRKGANVPEVAAALGEIQHDLDRHELVIRTDFTDEDAWNRVVEELREPWVENEAEPYLICEPAYDGVPAGRIIKAVRAAIPELGLAGVVFIADATTMHEETYPLLAVSTEWDGEPFAQDEEPFATQFRIRPNAAIEVSCNLGIGNMDFEDFAGDGDGVAERMVD